MSVQERAMNRLRRAAVSRMVLGTIALSLLLTAAFLGLVGLISGAPLDVSSRLPGYALVLGVAFVAAMLRLDTPSRDGIMVLVSTSGIALLAFTLVSLASEGVMYTIQSPDKVLVSKHILYFAAAGLVCTGVVLWSLHHWREFATKRSRL